MLYKNYRYIIIIKICLLVWWTYLLFSEWNKHQYSIWTTIIISYIAETQNLVDFLQTQKNTISMPLNLIVEQDNKTLALHIPQTNDIWYIINYIQNPKPFIEKSNEKLINTYITSCIKKIILVDNKPIVQSCQKSIKTNFLITMSILLLGLLL